jgi:hypothetical protein
MKTFCIKALAFAALLIPVALFTLYFNQPNPTSYFHGYQAKQELLINTQGPRMILVGGSNLALGLDSSIIADNIEGYTPVNMGLHAGLGRSLILNKAILREVHTGDLVVLCLEYDAFKNMQGGAPLCELVRLNSAALRDFRLHTYTALFEGAFSYVGGQMRISIKNLLRGEKMIGDNPIYVGTGFNEFGDLTSHWPMGHRAGPRQIRSFDLEGSAFERALSELSDFVATTRGTGADVVLSFPVIREDQYQLNKSSIDGLAQILEERLSLVLVNQPADFAFPEEYFFDTAYHLSYRGVRRRSEMLSEGLLLYLVSRD